MLTNADITELTDFRRELHRFPEISGEERETAARIGAALAPLKPDQILTDLGGHGVAAVFNGAAPGEILLGPLTAEEVAGRVAMDRRSISTKHEGDLPAFAVEWRP